MTKDLAITAVITPALFFLIGYTKETRALATVAVHYVGPTVVRGALLVFLMWVCKSIICDAVAKAESEKQNTSVTDKCAAAPVGVFAKMYRLASFRASIAVWRKHSHRMEIRKEPAFPVAKQ